MKDPGRVRERGAAGQVVAAWFLTRPSCLVLGYVLDEVLVAIF